MLLSFGCAAGAFYEAEQCPENVRGNEGLSNLAKVELPQNDQRHTGRRPKRGVSGLGGMKSGNKSP
jgi:hypothetical protein